MSPAATRCPIPLAVCLVAAAAAAQPAVSPADRATLEGSSSTSYPLGYADARVQHLHADLGTAALGILGHAYRRDAISTRGAVSGYTVDLEVTLSMSPKRPDQASSTFADNVGPAPVVVLPRTTLSFPMTNRPTQAPAPAFELPVPYAVPFSYPAGGGTLCIDTAVFGNVGPNGPNANFTAYLDAHEQFGNGRAEQPGFRTGQGCAPLGGSTAAYASFELRVRPGGMELDVQARYGVPTTATSIGLSALITGFQPAAIGWVRPSCQLLTTPDATWPLGGPNTSSGHWTGLLQGFAALPAGLQFYAQVVSGDASGNVALSDVSALAVPPAGPMPTTTARIANGSDHTAATGSVSATVPVVEVR